jgi:hypothetical protein
MDTILINNNIKKYYKSLLNTTSKSSIETNTNNSFIFMIILFVIIYFVIKYLNKNPNLKIKIKENYKKFDLNDCDTITEKDDSIINKEEKQRIIDIIDDLSTKNENDYIEYKKNHLNQYNKKRENTHSSSYLNINKPPINKSVIGDLIVESPFV